MRFGFSSPPPHHLKKMKQIKVTHFPFQLDIRLEGEEIPTELAKNIGKVATYFNLDTRKMSASVEFLPDPETGGRTHYVLAQVTYRGSLQKPNKKPTKTKR